MLLAPKMIKMDSVWVNGEWNDQKTVIITFDPEGFGGCTILEQSLMGLYLRVTPVGEDINGYFCSFDGGKSGHGVVSKKFFDEAL